MKKFIYIASICLAASLASCEDYLTVESPDQLTSGTFWRNQSDAEAGIAAAYSQLEYSINTWSFAEVKWPVEAFREDIVNIGTDVPTYPSWMELANFTYTNGNSQLTSYWQNNYRGISFCNQVIEKVAHIPDDKIDPTIRTQIVNEAHFLRGYYHMKLILNWNQIIIRDKYITNQEELSKPLSTRAEAWDFIIGEFKAATALPASYNSDNIGRATTGAAYSYLGFAYLTRAYEEADMKNQHLEEAVKAFDAVSGYELEKNFISMFDGTNKNSKESIFELQFSMSTASGANYQTALHKWMAVTELTGWDEIVPSTMLMDEFMKEGKTALTGRYDSRLYESVFFQSDYFNDPVEKRVYGFTYDELFKGADKPAFRKFLPSTYEELKMESGALNVPLMRYANVLLMKAEALNELNRTAEAIPLINQVREIHGDMPPMTGTSKEAVSAQIEHERIIEFPLENFRWYDLRRWGKLGDKAPYSFFPVPLSEINTNDKIEK